MLYADKNALRTSLKVNMLRIRERELSYYTNNCLSISTSAALLAGFAWYGLTEVPFNEKANVYTQTLYLVVTTLIMGLELLTVVNATLCAILGPGLALRGPDGSMHDAVTGMMIHYRFTLACFTGGIIFFMISALLYAWMQFNAELAVPMTLVIIYFLVKIYGYFWRIYNRFKLPAENVISGAFNVDASPAENQARQAQQAAEMEELRKKYAQLPESVKSSLGISSGAGPSNAH
ncbi:hypothetical protein AB1Y20_005453 [Prymnesium parvum]|uniref:Uncharacterized protein n=1 Tax=Prymnesium parvum TaxID=97485 RepID=A0AB34J3E4_PRYPA|mmetsp:Transcript_35841/g.89185  ORF Transcript_35841/g.89185 Transcript_35841/m.89185 type:complete len:234 (-) Transcript_35841:294-995(-)